MTEKINYKEKQIQSHCHKSQFCKQDYLSAAEGFLKRELDAHNVARTAGNICKALKTWSEGVRGNTYRKMQCSLEYHQYSHQFYKAAEQIRYTKRVGYGEESGKKRKICKSINEKEHFKLLKAAMLNGNDRLISILTVSYYLGIRPVEASTLKYEDLDDFLIVNIVSAKQNDNGTRGIDRELYLELESNAKYALINAIDTLSGIDKKEVAALRKRVCRLSRKVFEKRKHPPTLVSYRHQLGSDLKSSQISSSEKSGVLGHFSQKSIEKYGHFNSGGGLKRDLPLASEETIDKVMDDIEITNYKLELNEKDPLSLDVDAIKESPPIISVKDEEVDIENTVHNDAEALTREKSALKTQRKRHKINPEYTPF